MTTNIKQFNSTLTNAMSDATYLASGALSTGLQSGLASSQLHNKLFAQTSIVSTAIAQMLDQAAKFASDTSLIGFQSSLMTFFRPAQGCDVAYVNSTTVSISSGLYLSDDDTTLIPIGSPGAVNLSTSGYNGLDTGSRTASSGYYIFTIANPSGGVGSLASLSPTAPTLPSGYTKKRLVGYVFNNSANAIEPFDQRGTGLNRRIEYRNPDTANTNGIGIVRALVVDGASVNSGTWYTASLYPAIPKSSQGRWANLKVEYAGSNAATSNIANSLYMRAKSDTSSRKWVGQANVNTGGFSGETLMPVLIKSDVNGDVEYFATDTQGRPQIYIIVEGFELTI